MLKEDMMVNFIPFPNLEIKGLFSYIYSVAFNNWTEIIPLLILREILKLTVYGNVIVFK